MATITKRPQSKFYYALWRIPLTYTDGKRAWRQFMRCTKHEDKAGAKRAAAQMEEASLRQAGAGEDGSRKILVILTAAAEKAAQKRLTIDLGRDYLRQILALSSGEQLKVWSTRQWLTEWLAHKLASAKPATQLRYKHSVTMFLEHLGETADLPIEHLTVAHIRDFRDKLHSEGRAAKTCNGYQKDVAMALTAAVREGYLPRSPAANVDALPEEDSLQREPFALADVVKLIKAAPSDEWRGMILLGAYGGFRIGDAAALKAGAVNLKERVIRFVPKKPTRRGRPEKELVLPMHKELLKFFKACALPKDGEQPCFPTLARTSVAGNDGLSLRFVGIMEAAKVSRGTTKLHEEGTAGRTAHSRSFHSLRHTFNSEMLNGGVTQEMRIKVTGHATESANAIYSHAQLKTLRASVDAVPALNGKKKKGGSK